MTPVERQTAIEKGLPYDRVPCVPFIGNMRCLLLGIGTDEYENSAKYMADGEIAAFNRFGFDRLAIGPNTRGIADALCIQFPDYEKRGTGDGNLFENGFPGSCRSRQQF